MVKTMKKLSLQWRITLMTVLLIGATCVAMNLLLSYSGRRYMDSIGSYMTNYGETDKGEPDFFDPEREKLDQELTIVIHGAQDSFATTGWYITVAVTVLSGVLAYFFQRSCPQAPAYLRVPGGAGTAEQSPGHENYRGCPAGIPAVQQTVQPDAGTT